MNIAESYRDALENDFCTQGMYKGNSPAEIAMKMASLLAGEVSQVPVKRDIESGPLGAILCNTVVDFKLRPQSGVTNGNLVLFFESGKKLFITPVVNKRDGTAVLFFSKHDES